MKYATAPRRALVGLLGLALIGSLTACVPSPVITPGGDPGSGITNNGSQGSGNEGSGSQGSGSQGSGSEGSGSQGSGSESSGDLLTGGITLEGERYRGETVSLYQNAFMLCLPEWVNHPTADPAEGQYWEFVAESATEGIAVCANTWGPSDSTPLAQTLPPLADAAAPTGEDFAFLKTIMASRIYSDFLNPFVIAEDMASLRELFAERGAQVELYGDADRVILLVVPATDDPGSPGVVYGSWCTGRCLPG